MSELVYKNRACAEHHGTNHIKNQQADNASPEATFSQAPNTIMRFAFVALPAFSAHTPFITGCPLIPLHEKDECLATASGVARLQPARFSQSPDAPTVTPYSRRIFSIARPLANSSISLSR